MAKHTKSHSRDRWQATGALTIAAIALTLPGCPQPVALRRLASSCVSDGQCDTGLCFNGFCSRPCVADSECGALLCLDLHCLPKEAPCDDSNACTIGDNYLTGTCTGTTLNCAPPDTCATWSCDPAVGCTPTPRNEGAVCGDLERCSGGLCRCTRFERTPAGPGGDGGQLYGVHADGANVIAVGETTAPGGGQGWLLRLDPHGDEIWSKAIAAAHAAAGPARLSDVAPAADGSWLAVGEAGDPPTGWLVRAGADGKVLGQDKAVFGSVDWASLHAVAAAPSGFLAVGAARAAATDAASTRGWLQRIDETGKPMWGQLLTVKGKTDVPGVLYDVVALADATPQRWHVVGEAGADAKTIGWTVAVADDLTETWNKTFLPSGEERSGFRGLLSRTDGGVDLYGWLRKAGGADRALQMRLDATGAPTTVTTAAGPQPWRIMSVSAGTRFVTATRFDDGGALAAGTTGDGKRLFFARLYDDGTAHMAKASATGSANDHLDAATTTTDHRAIVVGGRAASGSAAASGYVLGLDEAGAGPDGCQQP